MGKDAEKSASRATAPQKTQIRGIARKKQGTKKARCALRAKVEGKPGRLQPYYKIEFSTICVKVKKNAKKLALYGAGLYIYSALAAIGARLYLIQWQGCQRSAAQSRKPVTRSFKGILSRLYESRKYPAG